MKQHPIKTMSEQPVKSLGKWFREALNDKASIEYTIKQAVEWMDRVEKSGLPNKYKA